MFTLNCSRFLASSAVVLVLVLSLNRRICAQASPDAEPANATAYPELPGLPPVKFDPRRPIPAKGNVRDIESLTTPPEGMIMQRRNNFYRRDAEGRNAEGTGLYRWANTGHFSNYDEAQAGDYKKLPDLLVLNNGQPVGEADAWRRKRRAEVLERVETAIYGKVPPNLPKLQWTSSRTTNDNGNVTTVATGQYVNADGSPFLPAADRSSTGGRRGGGPGTGPTLTYTVPANAGGAVPLVQGGNAQQVFAMGFGTVNFGGNAPNVSTGRPDDWGAIRKSAWVASRCLDYLETDPSVDAHQIALTGHSIGGKIALVRGVMDERIGLVFASCSGEGGASLMRRDWGETIDDLVQLSPQNYCPNFKQWAGNWHAMPADAHMLVALMAPRPLFITGGTDDQWSDPVGVFWAGYFGSTVYKLLGAHDLGVSEPPKPNSFVGEELVFYNHVGGHITTREETAKYHEMIRKHFKVKPFAADREP
jgi:hypothetical protein